MGNINANRFRGFRDNGGLVYRQSTNNLICEAVDMRLPNILNWHSVAILWACDGSSTWPSVRDVDIYFRDIFKAFKSGELEVVAEYEEQTKANVVKQGVERQAFIDWLKSIDRWPIDGCLLISWFVDLPDEQPVQEVAVNLLSNNRLIVKEPQSKDDWSDIIFAAFQSFLSMYDKQPSKKELWNHILKNTMLGFDITLSKASSTAGKNEGCLVMDGDDELILKRSDFNKRYKRYFPPESLIFGA